MTQTISNDLFMAILSMDAYNRGYEPGVVLTTQTVGNATVTTDSERVFSATDQPEGALSEAGAAGFYAVAYDWNGQTVISYRGTDALTSSPWIDDPGSDVWNDPVLRPGPLTNKIYDLACG